MALHNSQSDGTHHPAGYFQSGDPGAVGAGKYWVDTTGAAPYPLKIRNSGDSAWESVGSTGGGFDYTDFAANSVTGFRQDFYSGAAGAIDPFIISGTFSVVDSGDLNEAASPGIAKAHTSTSATGAGGIYSGNSNYGVRLGGGATVTKARVRFPLLSTSAERYRFVCGLINTPTQASITNGVFFDYDEGVAGDFWRIRAGKASTFTTTTTTTAVAADTWYTLEIRVNAAAGSVSYYVNGTEVSGSPITTNIPDTLQIGPVFNITKSVGTTQRNAWIDFFAHKQTLTAAR